MSDKRYGEAGRNVSVDCMKGILVSVMMYAHIIQFFPGGTLQSFISTYANLTTFSGFMFCFGYAAEIAYLKRLKVKRLLYRAVRTLIIFYISSIAWVLFIEENVLGQSSKEIILFRRIAGYSEFLLSFALSYIVIILMYYVMRKANGWLLGVMGMISLLSTFLPYEKVNNPILGSLIGTCNYAAFPLLQYGSYFLAGVYLCRKKDVQVNNKIFFFSALGTLSFLIYCIKTGGLPGRFPPTVLWICGGYFFIYLYYLVVNTHVLSGKMKSILAMEGRNSITYLLGSNVIIFGARYIVNHYTGTVKNSIIHFILVCLCFGGISTFILLKEHRSK